MFGKLILILGLPWFVSAAEFNEPWKDHSVGLVLDAYSKNTMDWDKLKEEKQLIAVIHKATTGTDSVDPKYAKRKVEARKHGYLWGSYHVGISGNPEKQADFYIDTVKPTDNEVVALDLEDVASHSLMSAEEAIRFAVRVRKRIGRYPVLYINHTGATSISGKFKNSVFARMPLWYANFVPKVRNFPAGVWSTYTLWQFSSEIKRQYAIPGTRPDIDINVYNGTVEQLKSAWPFTHKEKGF